MNSYNPKYLNYSIYNLTREIKPISSSDSLDLSFDTINNASVFPRKIYEKSPFAYNPSLLVIPRDINYLYTYSPDPLDRKERSTQTPTASRFGYDRFYNEYGLGIQSRGYIEPAECGRCASDTPKNMAPQRFYTSYHLENTPTEFRKMDSIIPKLSLP